MKTKHYLQKKLFSLLAVIALTSFFSAKADWVKNVTLTNYDFTTITTSPFTTGNSNLSGNNVGAPTILNGYMYTAASGSGGRGTKITNMTATTARQDTVYYEFDWNPYKLIGKTDSTGTAGVEPAAFGVCNIRSSNDSIVFGLWYERWSHKSGTKYNFSTGTEPQGDLHLMNLSTDTLNPMPARIVKRTVAGVETSYYTNTLLPYAMLDPSSASYYAYKCDSINKSTDLGKAFKMFQWYHIKAVIDFMNKKIISFDITQTANPNNKKSFTNLPFVNNGATDVSRLEIASTRGKLEAGTGNGVNCDYEQRFDNFDVYTMHRVAAAAPVTIRYKSEDGTEIQTAKIVPDQEISTLYTATASDKINILYNDEFYLYDVTSNDSVRVLFGGSEINLRFIKATPKKTIVNLSAPTTSELYKDVTVTFSVTTPENDFVSKGDVLLFVNNIVKNRIPVDVLGTGTVTLPNLLVGDENIWALYVGDRINYTSSDTAKHVVSITPSTASVKPYPVYFDLCDQPEIIAWDRARGVTTATPRSYSHSFRCDSIPGISVTTDTLSTMKVGYYLGGSTYGKIDDCYNRADWVTIPLGSNRPTHVTFKTPWLNSGSYNIYISHRVSGDPKTNMTTLNMDGKELYFPNEEMYGRWFKSWASANNRRRWNAKAHSGSMGMNYIGSVSVDNSGTHSLTINVAAENGATYNVDMLEFIPVDMDSLSINTTAAVSMAKVYYPMFDWVGFARQPGYDAATVPTTYADFTNFAISYQVTDQTDWGTKYTHIIDSVGLKTVLIGTDQFAANYVTVYRAEDKWTRVSEGYGDTNLFNYSCELPKGNYYYETINFVDLADGAADFRTFINSGYFTVQAPDAVVNTNTSKIIAFAKGNILTITGIKAGAKIMVTDLLGKIVVNTTSNSDVFTKTLKPAIYLVKVLSENDTKTSKIIVK